MDWLKLLAFLKKKGFTGKDDDLAAVKTFIGTLDVSIVDADDKTVDPDALFKSRAKPKLVLTGAGDDTGGTTNDDGSVTFSKGDADTYKAMLAKEREAARANGTDAKAVHSAGGAGPDDSAVRKHSPEAWMRAREKKHYNLRVGAGKAIFVDADQAEEFVAVMRYGIFGKHFNQRDKEILDVVGRKAQTEGVASQGGVLVPTEYVNQLMYVTEPFGVARKVANVVNMTSDVQSHPRKTGIATMVPVAENGTIPTSQNSYDLVKLTAQKFGRIVTVTSELLEDSAINVADDVARSMVEAQQNAEDDCYFMGNGASTYANIVGLAGEVSGATGNLPAAAYVNSSSATWTSIVINDLLANLAGVLQNVNQSRLAYICSRQFYYAVMLRLDVATSQFKQLSGGSLRTPDGMFMGLPVYFCQRMATASGASAGVSICYLGDFTGGSMIGDRRMLTIDRSDQAYWTSDAIGFRATSRFAINIHGDGKGSTYGPIVALTSV